MACVHMIFSTSAHTGWLVRVVVSFYIPKASTKAQLVEGKKNLLRMTQTIALTDEERAAIDGDVASYDRLLKQLAQVLTPDSEMKAAIGK